MKYNKSYCSKIVELGLAETKDDINRILTAIEKDIFLHELKQDIDQ